MSRKAIGHRDNGKVPIETMLFNVQSLRKVLVIEDQLTSARPSSDFMSLKFSRILHSADTV